jgi:hypothetical protein
LTAALDAVACADDASVPMTTSRTIALASVLLVAACGNVKDPTPKGTTLFDWDRSRARQHEPGDATKAGPPHPIASAKIVEGPEKHAYRITATDSDGKSYQVDIDLEDAKVTSTEDGKDVTRWTITKVTGKVAENASFHLTGYCDDRIGYVLASPGEVTNTVTECHLTGKRPNSLGTADAITLGAYLQIEGNGEMMTTNDPALKVEKR